MFSHGELSHGQVELYQIVQHKNIQSWEENELDKSQPTERDIQGVVYCRDPFVGEMLVIETLIFLLHCQPHSSLRRGLMWLLGLVVLF